MAFHIPNSASPTELPVLEELADLLSSRREELLDRWMEVVRAEPQIPAANDITELQLRDHLPQLIGDLAKLLRTGGDLSPTELNAAQRAREHSHLHGQGRWEQHYELGDLVRELSLLRTVVIDELARFEERNPSFSGGSKLFARTLVHRFIDDVVRRSSISYVEQQHAEIRRLSDSRLQLLRTFAHEMRNAMNVISLLSQSAVEVADSREQPHFATMMDHNIRSMRTMLDRLLELLRLNSTAPPPVERRPIVVAEFAYELSTIWRIDCVNKGLSFTSRVAPTLGTVHSDPGKLRQIAHNLLNNAVKFTASGEVALEFRDLDVQRWSLTTTDTGLGISPKAREHLFSEFYRAPGSENIPGSGLGLAITRRLVELLGGTISVESEPGKGSCFEVILPK